MLRQVSVLRAKDGKITKARVYCAGLHATFPDVDLDKRRRGKGARATSAGVEREVWHNRPTSSGSAVGLWNPPKKL